MIQQIVVLLKQPIKVKYQEKITQRKLVITVHKTWQCHKISFSHNECIMIYLLKNLNSLHSEFYGPIDPKINPHVCLDMTYPPAKFDVD